MIRGECVAICLRNRNPADMALQKTHRLSGGGQMALEGRYADRLLVYRLEIADERNAEFLPAAHQMVQKLRREQPFDDAFLLVPRIPDVPFIV